MLINYFKIASRNLLKFKLRFAVGWEGSGVTSCNVSKVTHLSFTVWANATVLKLADHRVAVLPVSRMKVEEEVTQSLVRFGVINAKLQFS